MQLSAEAQEAFKAHVLEEYPREACGVIAAGAYLRCRNVAPDPLRDFAISAEEVARIEIEHGPVTAWLHSHPYDPRTPPDHPPEWPSELDMESWMQGTTPWGIVATDGEGLSPVLWLDDADIQPLDGREFKWGVSDCYSLIRDWYRLERGITLKNYPRQWGHWHEGVSLYDKFFQDAGFVEVKPSGIEIGDVVMMKLTNSVSSHAGVVTGTDTFLHHHHGRLSGYDSLTKWRRAITRVVRYMGEQQ